MSRDKQTEIHELAKKMSEAISTEVERRYIEDEAKLRAVLIENGWRKASDVVMEMIEKLANDLWEGELDTLNISVGKRFYNKQEFIAELKKKYTEEGK